MSRFKIYEGFFKKQDVYYTKVEENMFDLVYKGDYKAVCSRGSLREGTDFLGIGI